MQRNSDILSMMNHERKASAGCVIGGALGFLSKNIKSICSDMKSITLFIFAVASFSVIQAEEKVVIGSRYDVSVATELRAGPSQKDARIVNQKASSLLKKIQYLSVDTSTTVRVTEIKGEWVKIEVVEPEWLAATHRGWIPQKSIKVGDASQKKEGWIRHTTLVYTSKETNSKPVGLLAQQASVGVADEGSGWLRLIHGPMRDAVTKKFLPESETSKVLYIEAKNFTDVMPSKW